MITMDIKINRANIEENKYLVATPIERSLSTIDQIDRLTTIITEDQVRFQLLFHWQKDINYALLEIRQKMDQISNQLPRDTSKPILSKFNPTDNESFMDIIIAKENSNTKIVRNLIQQISALEGIAKVETEGLRSPFFHIELDPYKLQSQGIDFAQVKQSLLNVLFNREYIGEVETLEKENKSKRQKQILLHSSFLQSFYKQDPNDFADELSRLPLQKIEKSIPLQNLGSVALKNNQQSHSVFWNNHPAIFLKIYVRPDISSQKIYQNIESLIADWQTIYGEQKIEILSNQANIVNDSLFDAFFSLIMGIVLAGFLIFIYLRDYQLSLIIIITLPFALCFTFLCMFLSGITLNLMSIGGLDLALGNVIDNAIIILHAVHLKSIVKNKDRAIVSGIVSVSSSLICSTLAAILVFFPLLFIQGFSFALFYELTLCILFSLFASLVSSFTLIPLLLKYFYLSSGETSLVKKKSKTKNFLNSHFAVKNFLDKCNRILFFSFSFIQKYYTKIFIYFLHRPKSLLLVCLTLMISIIPLFSLSTKEILGEIDQKRINLTAHFPVNSRDQIKIELSQDLQKTLYQFPEVEHVVLLFPSQNREKNSDPSLGEICYGTVYLKKKTQTATFLRKLKKNLEQIGNLRFWLEPDQDILGRIINHQKGEFVIIFEDEGQLEQSSINLPLKKNKIHTFTTYIREHHRDSYENLLTPTDQLASMIEDQPSILKNIRWDHQKLSHLGIDRILLEDQLLSAIRGLKIIDLTFPTEKIPLWLSYRNKDETSDEYNKLENLAAIALPTPFSREIGPLINKGEALPTAEKILIRKNQKDYQTVLLASKPENERALLNILEKLKEKFHFSIERNNQELETTLANLAENLILSIILIYALLCIQFNSLLFANLMMLIFILMLPGILFTLWIANISLNAYSLLGMIILLGISINSTSLIYEGVLEKKEKNREWNKSLDLQFLENLIIRSAQNRIQPLFLSVLCIILTLLPLAFAKGNNLQADIAISVLGGIFFTLILTLTIFPILLYYSLKQKYSQKKFYQINFSKKN